MLRAWPVTASRLGELSALSVAPRAAAICSAHGAVFLSFERMPSRSSIAQLWQLSALGCPSGRRPVGWGDGLEGRFQGGVLDAGGQGDPFLAPCPWFCAPEPAQRPGWLVAQPRALWAVGGVAERLGLSDTACGRRLRQVWAGPRLWIPAQRFRRVARGRPLESCVGAAAACAGLVAARSLNPGPVASGGALSLSPGPGS